MSAGACPRFEVRVVDEVLTEDLTRCTPAARAAIEPMVATLRGKGAPREWLRRREDEGQDGTRLKGCVKLYIPYPLVNGKPVLSGDEEAKDPALVLIAVGERHPARPWKPSVYEIAHRRLNS